MKLSLIICIATVLLFSCNNTPNNVLEGKLKKDVISIAPKVPGRIIKLLVNESDTVNAGDTLAILDIPEIEAKLQQARGAVLSAESQYTMAKSGATKEEKQQILALYESALQQFNFAKKSYERISTLYKDSLISDQQYDEIYTKYCAAQKQLDGATAKRNEILGGLRNEKIIMAEGQKKQAEGVLKEVNVAISERYIIAPKKMSIETIALKEGELALPGYNVFVGYDINSVYFRFTIPESKISDFKKGQKYMIRMPFVEKETSAKLTGIKELAKYAYKTSPYPNYQLGETVYELKLVPESTEFHDLFDGLTAILDLSRK